MLSLFAAAIYYKIVKKRSKTNEALSSDLFQLLPKLRRELRIFVGNFLNTHRSVSMLYLAIAW